MLPGLSGEHHTAREMDSNAIKLEEHRGVCWLPGTVTERLNGVPLCPNSETASVGETAISATDPDMTTQLEGSEETRTHKHKTFPRYVNRDRHDARQDAHLQVKSRSGKEAEHAYKPQAGTLGSETEMGRDHFFLVRTASPQLVKSSLESFGDGCGIFSHVGGRSRKRFGGCVRNNHTNWAGLCGSKEMQSRTRCATHRRRQVSVLEELSE